MSKYLLVLITLFLLPSCIRKEFDIGDKKNLTKNHKDLAEMCQINNVNFISDYGKQKTYHIQEVIVYHNIAFAHKIYATILTCENNKFVSLKPIILSKNDIIFDRDYTKISNNKLDIMNDFLTNMSYKPSTR